MTRCALFDFADTLAELTPRKEDIVSDYLLRATGFAVSPELIGRRYKCLDVLMPYSSVRSSEGREAFYRAYNLQLFKLLGVVHAAHPEKLFHEFRARRAQWTLKSGARHLLRSLRQSGVPIGIISNFDTGLESLIRGELGLDGLVDYLHVSQSVGLEKPDPHFYLEFFATHRLQIEHTRYVGDSYVLDFLPATRIGVQSLLLDEGGQYRHLPESIPSLEEALPLMISGLAA